MKDPAFTVVGGDVMPFTWGMGAPSTSVLEVKAGETYVIYNANKVGWSAEVTVSFTAASGDALKILSSEPEQGSKVDKISWDNQVKVTLNKKVKYVHCEFHGDEGIMHQYYTSEAEEGEDVIMVGPAKIEKMAVFLIMHGICMKEIHTKSLLSHIRLRKVWSRVLKLLRQQL